MLGPKLVFFVTVVGYLCNTGIYANMSPADIQKKIDTEMYPVYKDCLKEYGATETSDYKDLDPCVLACFFKKIEFMDSKGFFDTKKYTEMGKTYVTNEKEWAKMDKLRQVCEKVNDAEVSDGDKGCERSKLLIECLKEHADLMM